MIVRNGSFSHPARRGNALIPALMAVMLTAALCICYMQLSLSKNRESQISMDSKRAFYIAEAGLAEAYYGLARGMQGAVASESRPARFGNGVYWVTAEDLGDRVTLRSTGLSRMGRAALSTTLRKAQASVASLGLYSNQRMDLRAGSRVDAYDSNVGPYQGPSVLGLLPSDPGSTLAARVGCNWNINMAGISGLLPGAVVVGDANPGPSGTVVRGLGSSVSGSTAPAAQPTSLPALAVDLPDGVGPLAPAPGSPLSLAAGTYAWSILHLAANSLVHIDGPADVVLDQLVLDNGARLEIDGSNGPVRIRVRSYVNLAPGSTFTTLSQATDRAALLTAASDTLDRNGDGIADPPVTIGAAGPFFGLVYAPAAPLLLPSSFTVFGSVVADRITLGTNARMHFDRALLSAIADGSLPEFLCWRVVELPPSRLVDMGYDPLTVLKVNAVTPLAPKDAHYSTTATLDTTLRAWIAPVTDLVGL
jgi:hypothetical protein